MTVLIAIPAKDGVWVGSDALWCVGTDKLHAELPKWHLGDANELSFGFAGTASLIPEIRDLAQKTGCARAFCKAVREVFRELGWEPGGSTDRYAAPPAWDFTMIVTDGQRIWDVASSLLPVELPPRLPAFGGSGYDHAQGAVLGALEANPDIHPQRLVEIGLKVAIDVDCHSGGTPFVEFVPKPAS